MSLDGMPEEAPGTPIASTRFSTRTTLTKPDIFVPHRNASPNDRLMYFLYNLINLPRFLEVLQTNERGKLRSPPFLSSYNLKPGERSSIQPIPTTGNLISRTAMWGHIIALEERIDSMEDCLFSCGIQDIELEDEKIIWNVGVDVHVWKDAVAGQEPNWGIKVTARANDFGYLSLDVSDANAYHTNPAANVLKAETNVFWKKERNYTIEEMEAFERLLDWKTCVELLKYNARVHGNKCQKSDNPLEHMGITGIGFEMRKIMDDGLDLGLSHLGDSSCSFSASPDFKDENRSSGQLNPKNLLPGDFKDESVMSGQFSSSDSNSRDSEDAYPWGQ
jgi:hypothetical protein